MVILTFMLFGLLPLVLFRLMAFPKASAELKHGVKNNLKSFLNKQIDLLTLLQQEKESHARTISDAILSTLLIHGDEKFANLVNGKNVHEYLRLKTLLECIKADYGYKGIFICDSASIIQVATENEISMLGKNITKEMAFLNIQKTLEDGKTIFSNVIHFSYSAYSDDIKDEKGGDVPSVFLSYPIKDENRVVIGGVVLWMDISVLNQVMKNVVFGETGEAYLVNQEGIMITQSRFSELIKNTGDTCKTCHVVEDPDSQMITKGVKKCITGKTTGYDLKGYRDYGGLQVVGAWSWLKDFDMGLIVELDADEAFSALNNINSMTKSLMIAMLIPAFAMAILTYRKLSAGYMLKNLSLPQKTLLGVTIIFTVGFIIAILDGYELRRERGYLREQKFEIRNPFKTFGSFVAQRDEDFIKNKISEFKKELPIFKAEDTSYPEDKKKEVDESKANQSSEKSEKTWELK
ncbi:MAG: two-component sensor kinase [Candidatus Brocadia fulgida]|uniref:Two-component sensor kinase n=1 Tax=Candidatus Brocadia fulgida TaxID=380242 RepID=A0A0M2UUG7_9BACT|nr:MAG: two-component sensor kinase [Candidatus Brocadia fulgida]MBV6518571.1 hypothetical protein [Candidatus Brocadia fulgida]